MFAPGERKRRQSMVVRTFDYPFWLLLASSGIEILPRLLLRRSAGEDAPSAPQKGRNVLLRRGWAMRSPRGLPPICSGCRMKMDVLPAAATLHVPEARPEPREFEVHGVRLRDDYAWLK